MIYVNYDTSTLKVKGLYLENELEENENYIQITREEERAMLRMADEECGSLYVKNIKRRLFEARIEPHEEKVFSIEPDRISALEKEVNELKEVIKQLTKKQN